MKVVQVIPYFYPAWSLGGPVRCVYHISCELVRKGHEVTVLTTTAFDSRTDFRTSRREYSVDGVKVRYFRNMARLSGLYFSPGMIRALKSQIQNADVIHMHEFRSFQNVIAHRYATRFHKPYVLTAHGSIPRVVERFLLKKLFDEAFGSRILRDAFRVLPSSHVELQQLLEIGVPNDKVAIVPNGIDVESFENLPEPGSFKEKFGLDDESAMILFAGRIHKRKGIDFLLDAFGSLNNLDVVLVIAGPDDGYVSKLKERARRQKIAGKILFTGYVSEEDKLAAYVDSSVVIYPGIYESFPLVPLEAALCSKPVIVSDDSIIAEIVDQGGFGLSIKYGDVTQLREHMVKMLGNSEIAEEMGRKGREFVKENYNWREIVSKLESVYSNALVTN